MLKWCVVDLQADVAKITYNAKLRNMKISMLILFFTAFTSAVMAQNRSEDVGIIYLPQGSEQLSEKQYETFVTAHFSESPISSYHDQIFKKDDVIISYQSHQYPPVFNTKLEATQKQFNSILGKSGKKTLISSEIITVNSIRFLIIEFKKDNDYGLAFWSDYDTQNRFVNGQLYFNANDEETAKQFLDFMLAHFRFTEIK